MIENGEVKRMTTGANGETVLLGILDSGDSFGEQEIVQGIPYSATAQALGDVELWTISKNDFQQMLEAFPSLTLTITRMMADRLTRAQQVPPQARVQPYSPPPRPPAPRPSNPPPARRIQQPPSGARPIKPATLKGTEFDSQLARAIPSAPRTANSSHVQQEHKSTAISLGVARQHGGTHTQAPAHAHAESRRPTPSLHQPAPHFAPATARRQGPGFLAELGTLVTGLSLGGKLRALTLAALAVWFFLIVGPFTTVTTVSSAVGGLQLSNTAPGGASAPQDNTASTRSNSAGPAKVAFALPTNTPVPTRTPLPTFTPRPQPTAVRIVPTRTPAPVVAVAAAATPVPALPPIYMDPRLGPNGTDKVTYPDLDGVHIVPATVAHGQKFWRAVSVKFEGLGESGNNHNVYVKMLDESGKRAQGIKVNGNVNPEKPTDDICDCNYVIDVYSGGAPDVSVQDQYPSDMVSGMCLCGIKDVMRGHAHVNFKITFQLVTNP